MIKFRQKYAPGYCEYNSGYNEIRWDVGGCNLKCEFCWSPASRIEESNEPYVEKNENDVLLGSLRNLFNPLTTFIRFTGGEPTLYWNEFLKIFDIFEKDEKINQVPILIQTNGIEIGKGRAVLDNLRFKRKQRLLFEISFKGTSREEFSLLTGKSPDLYEYQLKAYEMLSEISKQNNNFSIIAVLGVYHSSIKKSSKYIFVNPNSRDILFENDKFWDKKFKEIWQTANLKWVEPLRMSPKGVWDNLYRRCGPEGSRILKYYPLGFPTNVNKFFPMKPKSYEYARLIVQRSFWQS